ncbi:hypothetical protein KXD40_002370 [Peronospora effusa]|uniref:Uncharacterized protein n=1 Tax=Peronospora effusa TaxID=542832 RepID=A0A3M6VGV9_9STRA|nr:hypothetical protein DD238_002511 [Peronospora effusa]UIZ26636.1 hypothetical protein KXD40_002370 [Peronospora effusa]CAI5727027.1 unnamed protein product [Peronospora effusa]
MNLRLLLLVVAASLGKTEAQLVLDHKHIRPFPQPKPITAFQKTAVKFKPQLKITDNCHPYPAVQKDGTVSGGLKWSGARDGDCKGSKLGSQIYARSAMYKNTWGLVYALYFPKGRAPRTTISIGFSGHRHNWEYIVLWLGNVDVESPDIDNTSIIAVAMSASWGHDKAFPEERYMNGTSLKVEYYFEDILGTTALKLTEDSGEFQDLITWDQLSELARYSLSNMQWDSSLLHFAGIDMPLKDGVINGILAATWPF